MPHAPRYPAPTSAEEGLALTYISTAIRNDDGSYVKKMGVTLPLLSEIGFGMDIGFAGRLYTAMGPAEMVAAPASVMWGWVAVSGDETLPIWDTSTLAMSMTPSDDYGSVNWTNTRSWKVAGKGLVANLDDKYWVNVNTLDDDPMIWGAGTSMRLEATRYGTVLEGGLDHLNGDGTFVATLSVQQKLAKRFQLGAAVSDVLDEPIATISAETTLAKNFVLTASFSDGLDDDDDDSVKAFKASYALTW
ncbi:hypothetical protein [Breoghania sp.]|uniref:hypothetical protein n=1 Tax=Breoghania sp. TaxID=2065378 RepID=UPI00262C94AA|nr:hypothetical protein [Breoghania sp.]MDJ0931335.1 hypothetical protein [Breoghania sp.]